MLKTTLFTSITRLFKEYYSTNLFSKVLSEPLIKESQKDFKNSSIHSKKNPESKQIIKLYIPNVIKVELESQDSSKFFITFFSLNKCNNYELIECYNQLNNIFLYLSPNIFASFIYDLSKEFIVRFNKTPFSLDRHKIYWEGKLHYIEESLDYTLLED